MWVAVAATGLAITSCGRSSPLETGSQSSTPTSVPSSRTGAASHAVMAKVDPSRINGLDLQSTLMRKYPNTFVQYDGLDRVIVANFGSSQGVDRAEAMAEELRGTAGVSDVRVDPPEALPRSTR